MCPNHIIYKMKQAQLVLIADHYLDFKDKEAIINLCQNQDLKESLQNALNIQSYLENNRKPDTAEDIIFKKKDTNGDLYFTVNQIDIRISKHLIQFNFPFIFRAMLDFDALRQAYHVFLYFFLSPFQTTEIVLFPSFWKYDEHEIKNEWHKKRLYKLQDKIVNHASSFKRSKLNLNHCLGEPTFDKMEIMSKKYKIWTYIKYKDLI